MLFFFFAFCSDLSGWLQHSTSNLLSLSHEKKQMPFSAQQSHTHTRDCQYLRCHVDIVLARRRNINHHHKHIQEGRRCNEHAFLFFSLSVHVNLRYKQLACVLCPQDSHLCLACWEFAYSLVTSRRAPVSRIGSASGCGFSLTASSWKRKAGATRLDF